jgi:hypothetical protein
MAGVTIWQQAYWNAVPTILVDATDVYDRIYEETARLTYSNSHTVATTVATMRTAWAFVGRANALLPVPSRVHVREPERAIDRVDDVYATFKVEAANRKCVIYYNGWIVWCGRPEVIGAWEHKLRS